MAVVLVTGGAGYIGSHTCKQLAAAGHTPVTYDSLEHGHRDAVRWGPLVTGDLRDRARLSAALDEYRPDCVLHFAAYIDVGGSVRDPLRFYENNVGGSLTLLQAMKDHGLGKIVFSSTCAIYGAPVRLPLDEDHPKSPANPYGASKWMVECLLRDAGAAHGLRSVALRYFNACGADRDGEIGERHSPETHALPLAILAAMGRAPAFHMFGTDYPTPDGTAIRDYIHVEDLADAHVRALQYLLNGGESAAFNLGTGRGTSVRELVDAVGRVSGRTVPVTLSPRRDGDVAELVAQPALAADVLGWKARHTDFDAIVRSAWRWHRHVEKTGAPLNVTCG